jgi:hypothetical protein
MCLMGAQNRASPPLPGFLAVCGETQDPGNRGLARSHGMGLAKVKEGTIPYLG